MSAQGSDQQYHFGYFEYMNFPVHDAQEDSLVWDILNDAVLMGLSPTEIGHYEDRKRGLRVNRRVSRLV